MAKQKKLEITPISAWLEDYELVEMPSGKVVGLRQVDVLSIITADGQIPNVLLPIIQGNMTPQEAGQIEMSFEDLKPLNQLLGRLTRACFVEPAIVEDMEDVKRGDGILVDMVPYNDKISLIAWNLGGQARVDAAQTFLEQQEAGVVGVQPSNNVSPESEPDS